MATNDPGLKYEERAGLASVVRGANVRTYGQILTCKRGPTKPRLCTSWEDFSRVYGGLKDDDIGPLSAYGFFAEGGQFLLPARLVPTDARHSSRVVLDATGRATGQLVTKYKTGQQDISISTRKLSTATAGKIATGIFADATIAVVSGKFNDSGGGFLAAGFEAGQVITVSGFAAAANNGDHTITVVTDTDITVSSASTLVNVAATPAITIECTGFLATDVTAIEVGDVLVPTTYFSGANPQSMVVVSVDSGTGLVRIGRRSVVRAYPVLTGTALYSASRHRATTTLTQALSTGSTTTTLASTNNIKVGTILLFLPTTISEGVPFSRTVTGVSGLTVTLDSAPAVAFVSGSKVVSCEFHLDVKEGGSLVESYKWLTMSPTHAADYVQDRLGPGISWAYGTSALTTSAGAVTPDAYGESASLSLTLASASGVAVGDWLRIVNTTWVPTGPGVTVQVKSLSGTVISFDGLGYFSDTVSNVDVYTATPTVSESDLNKSDFIVFDQIAVASGTASASAAHERLPFPYEDFTLTGGVYGTDPATTALVKGSDTAGARTGVYALRESDDWTSLMAFSAPGFLDTDAGSSNNRQALCASLNAWAASEGVLFIDSVPSTITRPLDAKLYRSNKVGLQSSYAALYFPQAKTYDPRDPSRVLNVPPEGWIMGLMARRATTGIHKAPANLPFITLFDGVAKVSALEHELLNEAGVNVLLRMKGRGFRPMGARTLLNADGTMRQNIGSRTWLIYFRRSLEAAMMDRLFDPSNAELFERLTQPVQSFLVGEFFAGVFGPSSLGQAFYVKCDESTTTQAELAAGDVNVHIGVALAPMAERIRFIVYGYEGAVSGVREVI